ncbi:MAG TPA: AsmA-like C-terminal region-containing protein [Tenuifilaceae bacterium]|nr:AsmA-like C-terminal region-containing protein [Tenuifilaceae bacterium]
MKKFIKWLLIAIFSLIALVLIAAIVIPIVFKPQLLEIAKKEINKQVTAKVEFNDFKVSILRGFPDVYIGLTDLSVVGTGQFEGETLVAFDEFSVTVDIVSVLKMENIEVKSILLDKPVMNAIIAKNGKANWDIVPPSDEVVEEETSGEPVEMRVALRKFRIRKANVSYTDYESNMKADVENLNFTLSGNMGLDYSDLDIETTVGIINFYMDGVRYMKNASASFDATIGADLANSVYAFKKNTLKINEIELNFDGKVAMPSDDIDVDVTFATGNTSFKSLLSMVPAIYMTDFKDLKTEGKLALNGWVKGTMTEKTMPSANINLTVENARFQYPDLPKSAENISIATKIYYDGVNDDKTTVDVSKFHVDMAGNPFDMNLAVRTPMSDMQLNGTFKGKIDFNSMADVIPLEDMKISGLLESNIVFGGRMSYIEKEQYEKFKANGQLNLKNFEFESPDLPKAMKISEASMRFSPQFVQLSAFKANIGKTDLQMSGRLENFIPYVFSDGTVKGTLNLKSSLIDANEFLTEGEETIEEESEEMTVIEVPKNIDFVLSSSLNKILYDKLEITNFRGQVVVRNGKVQMKNVNLNMLKGSMNLSGEYNTQNIKKPSVDFLMDIRGFDIPTTFNSLSMLEGIAPQLKHVAGNVSTKLTFKTLLDKTMSPILPSVNAYGRFASKNISISGSPLFTKVGDALKNKDLSNPKLNDFDADISVKDGKITIKPFDTGIKDIKLNIGGDLGLDQSINYKAKIEMPRSKLGAASQALDLVNQQAAKLGIPVKQSDVVKLNLLITGTSTKPKVRIATEGGEAKDVKEQVKEEVKKVVEEQVDKGKEEARRRAKEQADKLIADAEKEAAKIRADARVLAEKIRKEAETKAKKVENEAKGKGPIAVQVAKKAADKIREEGDDAAKKVIREADAKAQAIIDKAKAEAAKLEADAAKK